MKPKKLNVTVEPMKVKMMGTNIMPMISTISNVIPEGMRKNAITKLVKIGRIRFWENVLECILKEFAVMNFGKALTKVFRKWLRIMLNEIGWILFWFMEISKNAIMQE